MAGRPRAGPAVPSRTSEARLAVASGAAGVRGGATPIKAVGGRSRKMGSVSEGSGIVSILCGAVSGGSGGSGRARRAGGFGCTVGGGAVCGGEGARAATACAPSSRCLCSRGVSTTRGRSEGAMAMAGGGGALKPPRGEAAKCSSRSHSGASRLGLGTFCSSGEAERERRVHTCGPQGSTQGTRGDMRLRADREDEREWRIHTCETGCRCMALPKSAELPATRASWYSERPRPGRAERDLGSSYGTAGAVGEAIGGGSDRTCRGG